MNNSWGNLPYSTRKKLAGATSFAIAGLVAVAMPLWADGGWYLLIPPSEYKERAPILSRLKILDDKPLSQWKQESAYDSAEECEAVKHNLVMVRGNIKKGLLDAYQKDVAAGKDSNVLELELSSMAFHDSMIDLLLASRCIRSDDPRLQR